MGSTDTALRPQPTRSSQLTTGAELDALFAEPRFSTPGVADLAIVRDAGARRPSAGSDRPAGGKRAIPLPREGFPAAPIRTRFSSGPSARHVGGAWALEGAGVMTRHRHMRLKR